MRIFGAFLAVLFVITGGIYFWSTMDDKVPSTQEEGEETVDKNPADMPAFTALITYSESGYSPTTTTIKKGETVRFVNDAISQDSWPASAVHPTHALYPEKNNTDCLGSSFDACRGLKPGEFWEFTFKEKGVWKFHDHIHPSKTGSVIVQ